MIELKVAWGLVNSENAQNQDPLAENNLSTFEGRPMYKSYWFNNQDEVDAFKLAVSEMDGYLTGYIVQVNAK